MKTSARVVVVGGGLGAKPINQAIVEIAQQLLSKSSVVHVCGRNQYESLKDKVPGSPQYQLKPFVNERLADYLAAADVLVTRAGASALAEAASVGAATIIIPNDKLVGGHQTKNASVYADVGAAIVLSEDKFVNTSEVLLETIIRLLDHVELRESLSKKIRQLARPDAARQVAELIVRAAR